ncbi:MAG TPA: penicillin acylase family protein [Solirubrobacteraceae bacterium]|nr:penicillin acylase family protein [Solirubrobacteraceae bacterium]
MGTDSAPCGQKGRNGGRRFTRGRVLALLAVAAVAMCFPASAAASYHVSLTRTTGGVANVAGENFADLGYGIGYAQAQDGICLLAESFLTVDGERSKFLGPEGTFKNEAEGGLVFTNLNSDVYWTSIDEDHAIQKLLKLPYPQGPATEATEAVRGYAAGYDAYLKHIGGAAGVTNPACKGAAWVRPIDATEVWRRIYQVDDLAGNSALGPYAEANPAFGPPSDAAAALARRQGVRAASLGASIEKLAHVGHSNLMGSNGLAVGSEDATNGGGVVLANPHFPWHGSERFWEMNVEIPGKYHAIGAGIWGLPGINIGHNQHVAWTHTVSTNTTVTFWALIPALSSPTSYIYDNKTLRMKARTITVEALEHGELVPRSDTLYYSHYGPVIWEAGHAVAVDDANANNLRGVNQWLAISKAENASQLIESERTIQGVPWVNTIGADEEGNAFYSEIAVASSLTKAYVDSYCNVERATGSVEGPFVGDGDCELPESPGAIVPGILAGDEEPALVRKDYVENSNNSFWLANANSPLTGFSPALGNEEEDPGMRAQTAIDMVAQRMGTNNGGVPTDGLSPTPGFTAETMQEDWTKFRSLPAERALPGLREICNNAVAEEGGVIDGVNVSEACPVLDAYGATATLEDKGGWLFQEWFERAPNGAADFWLHPWTASEPVYTPNTLNTSLQASKEALAAAVNAMQERGIPLDASIGEVQRAPQPGAAPLPGCLEGDGCYAAIGSSFPSPTAKQAEVTGGTSIVMFTELQPGHEPISKALLAYSQSEDPTSPYYEDQTQRFSKNEWITLPWTPASVAEDAITPTLHLPLK